MSADLHIGRDRSASKRAAARKRSAYVWLRTSGLLLSVLVLGHFVATHVTTDVADTDSRFIDERWASVLWVSWDGCMLAATLAHAVLGLWAVTADYSSGTRRRMLRSTALAAALVVLAGGIALLTIATLAH